VRGTRPGTATPHRLRRAGGTASGRCRAAARKKGLGARVNNGGGPGMPIDRSMNSSLGRST
jgi:hypothetical protein